MAAQDPRNTTRNDAIRDEAPASPQDSLGLTRASSSDAFMSDWIDALLPPLVPPGAQHPVPQAAPTQAWPGNPFDGVGLGLWEVHLPDRSLRYSRPLLELLGHTPETLRADLDAWRRLVHPQDALRVESALTKHLTGQTPQLRVECRLRHASGHFLWVQLLGEVSEFDAEGQPLRMLCTHLDLSERRALETALRESEGKFRVLFETSPVGLAMLDLTGRWLDANSALCQLLGYEREALLRRSFQQLTHADDLSADLEQAERLLSGDIEGYCIHKRQHRADGSLVRVSFCNHLLRGEDGTAHGFLAQFQPVADLSPTIDQDEHGAPAGRIATALDAFDPDEFLDLAIEPIADRSVGEDAADALRPSRPRAMPAPSSYAELIDAVEADVQLVARHRRHLALLLIKLELRGRDEASRQALETELRARFRAVIRRSDLMAPYGDHGVAIVIKPLESPEQALRVIEELLAEARQAGEQSAIASVDACLGASLYPQDGDSGESLMQRAEDALARANEAGAHTFRFADGAFDALMADRSAALKLLRAALDRREVRNVYRPVLAVDDDAPRLLEVVPMFQGEGATPIRLSEVLTGSSQGELLQQVQLRISEQVDADLGDLVAQFGTGVPVAFRLPPILLREANVERTLQPFIALRRATAASIAVLIEEHLLASVSETVYLHLRELRENGVDFIVDGFGGSVSNFHRMTELMPRWVVIEPSLASRHTEPGDVRLLRALIRIARCVDAQVAWPAGVELPPLRTHRLDVDAALSDATWQPFGFATSVAV
jgi:PAS domain S-box-containing protein